MNVLKLLRQAFLSEQIMLGVIVANAIIVFIEESGIGSPLLYALDVTCTLLFVIEMAVKLRQYGWRGYWSKAWNRLDGFLVIASLPSLAVFFFPQATAFDISIVLIFRILRIFRFFRLFRAFPNFEQIGRNFWKAMKDSTSIFFAFVLLVLISSMLTCFFFKEASPEYFGTPLDSIYTTFRLCTIEGWYEIPDTISQQFGPVMGHVVRFYFIGIVIIGGVVGISLVNSVFVDAMVSDNNESLEAKVQSLQEQLDRIEAMLKEKKER